MLEDWTIYSWYCPNCKTQVAGLKNKKNQIRVICTKCSAEMVRTVVGRRHDVIDIYMHRLEWSIVTWNWGSIDMTMLEAFVKERNEALFSLDRKKIEAYMIKYGETEIAQTPDVVFWASVYKAICGVKDALEAIVSKAKAWLHEHGMSPNLAG